MPASARLLYYDLGMAADDDGAVEALPVIRMTGNTKRSLKILEENGYVRILDSNLVAYICDWKRNNLIKKDRYNPSVYKGLLEQIENFSEPKRNPSGTQMEPQDRLGKDRLGKDRIGKDRLGEDRGGEDTEGSATPLPEHEKEILVSEGLSPKYIEERTERASDYARAHKRNVSSVLREWWAADKDSYAEPSEPSFDTDEFFEVALRRSMEMLMATKEAYIII